MNSALNQSDVTGTRLKSINSKNEIVGSYEDSAGSHLFKCSVGIDTDKTIYLISGPIPLNHPDIKDVVAGGINDKGWIVGYCKSVNLPGDHIYGFFGRQRITSIRPISSRYSTSILVILTILPSLPEEPFSPR